LKLFGYWRSSATYRVRIALALKSLDYQYEPINLLKGEQQSADYLKKNPSGLVPTLITDDGRSIVQSLAIMEYLEETFSQTPILPKDPVLRAKARAIAATLACEAQPFMNLRIQKFLKGERGFDDAAIQDWLDRWPGSAMAAVETMIADNDGAFCVGDEPTIADCCLIPQVFGAMRFGVDMTALKQIKMIYDHCQTLPTFRTAHPQNQPDAPKES